MIVRKCPKWTLFLINFPCMSSTNFPNAWFVIIGSEGKWKSHPISNGEICLWKPRPFSFESDNSFEIWISPFPHPPTIFRLYMRTDFLLKIKWKTKFSFVSFQSIADIYRVNFHGGGDCQGKIPVFFYFLATWIGISLASSSIMERISGLYYAAFSSLIFIAK